MDERGSGGEEPDLCKKMRALQLGEEAGLDPNHSCHWEHVEKRYTGKNLIQFVGFVRNLPVAYAAFFVCPCTIFVWKYFYIIKPFRKLGVALPFARTCARILYRRLGPSLKVEITYNVNNEQMKAIARYLGIDTKPQYITGVIDVGKVSFRGRNCSAGQAGY